MEEHDLLATSWTWAGTDPVVDRVRAVAAAGFSGLSIGLDDLHEIRATIGFPALRRVLDDVGIVWVQLGTLDGWWTSEDDGERADADRGVLLEAAAALRAWQVVAAADTRPNAVSPTAMLEDWVALAVQTDGVGAQLLLEPEPWSNLPTIERASRFVRTADHPATGLLVDAMHVHRGGSTLSSIGQGITPGQVLAVELSDGLWETPPGMTLAEESQHARHLPGSGTWDLPGLIRTVRDLGFDEPWGVEVRTPAHRAMPLAESLRTAVAATRAVLDAADAYGAPAAPAMPTTPAPTSAVDFDGRPAPSAFDVRLPQRGQHRDADTSTPA